MLDNLSQRERILALVVVSLLPLVLLTMTVIWFSNQYFARRGQITSLRTQIATERKKQLDAAAASQRRSFYRSMSLPTEENAATIDYHDWLGDTIRKHGMEYRGITPKQPEKQKFRSRKQGTTEVYVRHPYTLRTIGTLEELTKFLHEFYELDLLHRITSLSIIPRTETSGPNKKLRNGELTINMDVDVLALVDADSSRDFLAETRKLERPLDDYTGKIVTRNIFGPANNTPTVTISNRSHTLGDSDVSFTFTGRDPDKNDILSYELLGSNVHGATVAFTEKSRTATFRCPQLAVGDYDFRVKVWDNGFPSKSSETSFVLTMKEPDPEDPPPPPYKHIGETTVTGIAKESSGDMVVWINNRIAGKLYKLKSGESFQLDKSTWTVHAIMPRQVVLREGNRLMTFNVTDHLDSPRSQVSVTESAATATSGGK